MADVYDRGKMAYVCDRGNFVTQSDTSVAKIVYEFTFRRQTELLIT